MAFVDWQPALSVQVQELDAQHHKLVDMLNELHTAMRARKGHDTLNSMMTGLKTYAAEHFSCEERYMKQLQYPQYDAHHAEHLKFVKQLGGFEREMALGNLSSAELLGFLRDWTLKHIQGVDKAYGPYLNSKGVR